MSLCILIIITIIHVDFDIQFLYLISFEGYLLVSVVSLTAEPTKTEFKVKC